MVELMNSLIPGNNNTAFAITWWFAAMIVCGIAQGKNRSGFGWFIVSLILQPPIALTILVVFCKKLPYDPDRKLVIQFGNPPANTENGKGESIHEDKNAS